MTTRTHEGFLAELRRRGATAIRRVVFRHNRTRLLSISRDRVTLNAHICFLAAPPEVLDAVARFVTADPRTAAHRRAVEALREWPGVEDGLSAARARRPPRRSSRPVDCCASPEQREFLSELYARLNATRFGGRLPPDLPLRVSARMARRLGQVRFESGTGAAHAEAARASAHGAGNGETLPAQERPPGAAAGVRGIVDLALSADLFVEGNDRELLDTILHEMAHVEAFLLTGHKGHGASWKSVARRVGCEPRACTRRRIHRRRRGAPVPGRVPKLPGELARDSQARRPAPARRPGKPVGAVPGKAGDAVQGELWGEP